MSFVVGRVDLLVEVLVLVLSDILRVPGPDRRLLVHVFVDLDLLLDSLLLLLLLLLVVRGLVDLILLLFIVLLLVILLLRLALNLYLLLARLVQVDRVADEHGVLLDQLLKAVSLQVLLLVLLEVKYDLGTAQELVTEVVARALLNLERATGCRAPLEAAVVVVLGDNLDLLGDKVRGVEPDTKLTNEGDIGALGDHLHELLRARLGDRAEAVDQVGLRHADTSVTDDKNVVLLAWDDVNLEVLLLSKNAGARERGEVKLIESVGSIRDELTEEDLLRRVERVDDEIHQLRNLSLELKDFGGHPFSFRCH